MPASKHPINTKTATIFDIRQREMRQVGIWGAKNHSSILPVSGEFFPHHSISKRSKMSSLLSPIKAEQRERGQKRGNFKRGAIPVPTSFPNKSLVVHIQGEPALHQALYSTPKNLAVGFQCVLQQQKSSTPGKDQRKFRFGSPPQAGLARGPAHTALANT